jgi:hypothetical protein
VLEITVNKTRLMVLIGIKIAAIIGERRPETANDKPIKLYNSEMIKLIIIIRDADFENEIRLDSLGNCFASTIPSLAGVKEFVLSVIDIPTSL